MYLDALVDGMLKGLSEQVANVRYNTITSALDVALLFVLLPRYGLGGYVFTFIAAHLVNFALSLRRLLRVTGLRASAGAAVRTALLAAGAGAAALLTPAPGPEAAELLRSRAQALCQEVYGRRVFIRGLIEFTNFCKNDCYYCGIRRSNRDLSRYRLTEEEIIRIGVITHKDYRPTALGQMYLDILHRVVGDMQGE